MNQNKTPKKWTWENYIMVPIIGILIIAAIAVMVSPDEKNADNKNSTNQNATEQSKTKKADTTEEIKLEEVAPAPKVKPKKPKTLGAGEYKVGHDFPAGRYRATNIGKGTNFVVYSPDGYAKVNTILGKGSIGSGDYTFWAEDGDRVKTAGQVKLIPVE
jgi:hypothetical protein